MKRAGEGRRRGVVKKGAVMVQTNDPRLSEAEKSPSQRQLIVWSRRFPPVQACPTGTDTAKRVANIDEIDQPHPCYFADSLSVQFPFFVAFRNFLWRRIRQFGVALIGTSQFLIFQVNRN